MIATVLLFTLSAFAMGGLGMVWANQRAEAATRRNRWIKFAVYFCIVHLVLVCAILGPRVLGALMVVVLAAGAWELYRALRAHIGMGVGIGIAYLLLGTGLIRFVLFSTPEAAVYVYLVVAAFDGFSQVTGQLAGKHRLAGRISPGKTVEGALGGLLLAAATAIALRPLVHLDASQALASCIWIVLAGLSGDLSASWVKRWSGIKDFGSWLPGHGGVLDRFDSFLFAAPVALIALYHGGQ